MDRKENKKQNKLASASAYYQKRQEKKHGVKDHVKGSPTLSLEQLPQMGDIAAKLDELRQPLLQKDKETKQEGWEILKNQQLFLDMLKGMKGILFKRDQPYRSRLPLQGNVITTSGGLMNATINVSGVTNVAEWSSIDALFDECFVHSLTLKYVPVNVASSGMGTSATTAIVGPLNSIADTAVSNCGLLAVCIFSGGAAYTTAAALAANATARLLHTGKDWEYVWRNNTRFDPRGPTVTTGSGFGWQGWTGIASASTIGGVIQLRALNDQIIGTGSAAVTTGSYLAFYDVSFRARS